MKENEMTDELKSALESDYKEIVLYCRNHYTSRAFGSTAEHTFFVDYTNDTYGDRVYFRIKLDGTPFLFYRKDDSIKEFTETNYEHLYVLVTHWNEVRDNITKIVNEVNSIFNFKV